MADYITMKQVPGGTVTAKDDRIVYDANMADSGIIYGCGITYAGNNMIHINAGFGIIKGGMFEMEDHTEYVDLAENEPTNGQIYLHLDLSADDKLTIVKETTNSLHPMVQNANANFTNGIYEMQLCTFTATTTALEDVTQTFAVIQNQVLDTLAEIMANTTGGLKAGALALKEANGNLIANGQQFYFDEHDGQYGWNESSTRGADTFHPFKSIFHTFTRYSFDTQGLTTNHASSTIPANSSCVVSIRLDTSHPSSLTFSDPTNIISIFLEHPSSNTNHYDSLYFIQNLGDTDVTMTLRFSGQYVYGSNAVYKLE